MKPHYILEEGSLVLPGFEGRARACSATCSPAQPCLDGEGISSQTCVCWWSLLGRKMSENPGLWLMNCEERQKIYNKLSKKKRRPNQKNPKTKPNNQPLIWNRDAGLQAAKGIFSVKWAFKLCHKIRLVPDINPSQASLPIHFLL